MTRLCCHRHMIRSLYGIIALLTINSGCGSGSKPSSTTETADSSATVSTTDSLCFQQTLNRDTTTLKLLLTGDRASGQIDINPYEKDRARGPFTGTRTGNIITADWQRSGEGMTDTYVLALTLAGDSISWGEGERVQQQGKWALKQPGGTYRYALAKTSCR